MIHKYKKKKTKQPKHDYEMTKQKKIFSVFQIRDS